MRGLRQYKHTQHGVSTSFAQQQQRASALFDLSFDLSLSCPFVPSGATPLTSECFVRKRSLIRAAIFRALGIAQASSPSTIILFTLSEACDGIWENESLAPEAFTHAALEHISKLSLKSSATHMRQMCLLSSIVASQTSHS